MTVSYGSKEDQKFAKQAEDLLVDLCNLNTDIPSICMIAAMFGFIAKTYRCNNVSYQDFKEYIIGSTEHFKKIWETET